jgi:hypothetical protein
MAGEIFSSNNLITTWTSAALRLCNSPTPTFLAVSAGKDFAANARQIRDLNRCAEETLSERPGAIAEVLCPHLVLTTAGTTEDRVNAAWALFGRARRRGVRFSGWRHTYFERLTGSFMDGGGNVHRIKENRLASVIDKIRSWNRDVQGALYIHTELETDSLRPRGAPCLQYLQVRLFDGNKLELYALYRSHDYQNKALGNMIGLQRLGTFIAARSGREYIGQTVFSLHPLLGRSKHVLQQFAQRVSDLNAI